MKSFNKTKLSLALGLATAALLGVNAMAATDGTLGTSSNGDVDVTITRGALVQVSFPNGDIGLTYADDNNPETATETFCIYSNQGTVDIDITVDPTNDNTAGASQGPVLISGANELDYTLALKLAGGTQISVAADDIGEDGVTVLNHATANTQSTDCTTGGHTHEFQVSILEADFEAVPAGAYADTIDVTVAAN